MPQKDLRRETPCFYSLLEPKHKLGDEPLINVKTGLVLYVKTAKTQAVGFISRKCRPLQSRNLCLSQTPSPDLFIAGEVLSDLAQTFT